MIVVVWQSTADYFRNEFNPSQWMKIMSLHKRFNSTFINFVSNFQTKLKLNKCKYWETPNRVNQKQKFKKSSETSNSLFKTLPILESIIVNFVANHFSLRNEILLQFFKTFQDDLFTLGCFNSFEAGATNANLWSLDLVFGRCQNNNILKY